VKVDVLTRARTRDGIRCASILISRLHRQVAIAAMSVLGRFRRQTTIKISHQRAVKPNSLRLSPVRGACGRGVATASMVFPAAGAILAAQMRRRLLYNFPVTIAGAPVAATPAPVS